MLHQSGVFLNCQGGELALYNHNFILRQLIVAANQPKDIKTYVRENNETKLIVCIYDQVTGDFFAYIILRGDDMECFFSYGYNDKNLKVLYSAAKDKFLMP